MRTTGERVAVLASTMAIAMFANGQQPFEVPPLRPGPRGVDQVARRDNAGQIATGGPRAVQNRISVESREYMVETGDRWKLVAHRYTAKGVRLQTQPIILCHGFTFNSRFFDLQPNISLASYLAENGYDVWSVDLRGCGKSHKWALAANGGGELLIGRLADKLINRGIPPTGYVSLDLRFAQWTMDDHVDKDVPAFLGLICKQTNAKSVTWIGHSMGGNVMLAYLAKNGQDARVGKVATIGSQVTMSEGRLIVEFLTELLAQRQAQLAGRRFSAAEVFAGANNVFYNQRNVASNVTQELVAGQEAPSLGLVRQYMDLAQVGKLKSANKQFDYSANLGKIRCPLLICGGAADQVAPPLEQYAVYERAVSAKRTLMILGRSLGLGVDYGHCDAIVGPNARAEVYPRLARWLADN